MKIDRPDWKEFPEIVKAYKREKLVIFVGAGVSAIWGCYRWKDMARAVIEGCYAEQEISYWTKENLLSKHGVSPRKLISIAKSILEEKGKIDKYYQFLNESIQGSEKSKQNTQDLYKNLSSLNAIFITTNIDKYLSDEVKLKTPESENNVHFKIEEFEVSNLKSNHVFHLHGVIDNPTTMVMSIDEYIVRYNNKRYVSFLKEIFFNPEYVLMFIGYGVDEMELIDYMIEKHAENQNDNPKLYENLINRFYVLLPFFRNDGDLLVHEKKYFQLLNMEVIPYAIDENGYDELYGVIAAWKKGLMAQGPDNDFYNYTKLIEDLDE